MRGLAAMAIAAATGVWGLTAYPLPPTTCFCSSSPSVNPWSFARCLRVCRAVVQHVVPGRVAAPFRATISAYRGAPAAAPRALPRYPTPETRPTPALVLGETHHHTSPGRAPDPTWLTVPQRGLYTGVMILGAVGTGKTSACMYPYVEQLLRWRAQDPDQKVGGLVLEVKGDFCHQVRDMLARADRADDYLEIGLDTGFCYNPLHNDLDPVRGRVRGGHAAQQSVRAIARNRSGNRRTRTS